MGLADKHNDEITQYLLGELSAAERVALEEKYFDDDELFTQIAERENDLIADYQHNRLAPVQRQLFEQNYLAHPGRQAHAGFIQSLTQTLATEKAPPPAPWERWRAFWFAWNAPLAFAASAAAVLLLVGIVWLWRENRQLRDGLEQAQQAQNNNTQHTQDLQQQLSTQQQRSDELAAEIEQLRAQKPALITTPPLGTTIISLLLSASGSRTSESERPPELKLTPDTKQVRLQLKLKKNEYARYQVTLEQVGGNVIWTQRNLKARGLFVDVLIPANKFVPGDYILNLAGVNASGEAEDLAKPFFRVPKR